MRMRNHTEHGMRPFIQRQPSDEARSEALLAETIAGIKSLKSLPEEAMASMIRYVGLAPKVAQCSEGCLIIIASCQLLWWLSRTCSKSTCITSTAFATWSMSKPFHLQCSSCTEAVKVMLVTCWPSTLHNRYKLCMAIHSEPFQQVTAYLQQH